MKRATPILGLFLMLALRCEWGLANPEPSAPVTLASETLESPSESEPPIANNTSQEDQLAPDPQDQSLYRLSSTHQVQRGLGSWYGPGFHGRRTASGLLFDMHAFTAAHRTLPLLSYVKVTLADTGTYVIAQITDRGPFVKGRIIDLSKGAATALGLLPKGLATVIVEPIVALTNFK